MVWIDRKFAEQNMADESVCYQFEFTYPVDIQTTKQQGLVEITPIKKLLYVVTFLLAFTNNALRIKQSDLLSCSQGLSFSFYSPCISSPI